MRSIDETDNRRGASSGSTTPRKVACRQAPPPRTRVPARAEGRGTDCGRRHPCRVLDREQRREHGDAAHEVVRGVDRIDVPAHARRALRVRAELLADDPVPRERGGDPLPCQPFDAQVGVRDERTVLLAPGRHALTEELQRDGVGLVAHRQCQVEERVRVVSHMRSSWARSGRMQGHPTRNRRWPADRRCAGRRAAGRYTTRWQGPGRSPARHPVDGSRRAGGS